MYAMYLGCVKHAFKKLMYGQKAKIGQILEKYLKRE